MSANIKPLVAGNWKMNGLKAALSEFTKMSEGVTQDVSAKVDTMICPPATLIFPMVELAQNGSISVGAQDCHMAEKGAHTGCLSAQMLADAGASAIIVGHSERRADQGETDDMVRAKAEAAWSVGATAIICVGETEAERKAGEAVKVVAGQLAGSVPDGANATNTVIAYEPVWAIGTGLTPTAEDVADMHSAIRAKLVDRFGEAANQVRILYGGSVKPSNAAELMAVENVNGALVGGASLKAEDFLGILAAYK
ncbi:triose-phosphate isomerase [Roseibium sp. TrichSKD4]|uniref:triose-phosphate isomerase n=1 Tax=Roseibium sp. TrichSKD4 TaxID=744980 RepID=UPI00058FD9D1|nr:triose-phosphate isomerase [Roseibium sp. TrichSKD4]